ncbi:unnamed protein product [Peronospora destructor]|uniref:Crinkler effector protein N-terminal domain-containing protein n=1 Tax=Peronospora destructor TaxID=86335 RepID=A0AAV0UVH4_9STRA|nr:unnamed protein product [Peronospora destructor]
MVNLICAIVGTKESVFSVDIDANQSVGHLKNAIKAEKANDLKDVDADKLRLFPAKTEDGTWLSSSTEDVKKLKEGEKTPHVVELTEEDRELQGEDSIANFLAGMETPEARQIHVLVVVPEQAQAKTRLWLVSGFVENAQDTKGIRCCLYRLASSRLGCYDPARRTEDKDVAFWYEDKRLCIHVLFQSERAAWKFQNDLDMGPHTFGSPLSDQAITCKVTRVEAVSTDLQHVMYSHYYSQESDLSSDSSATVVSVLDPSTDEFRYQRIEHEWLFVPYGKAESCHLVSKKQCNDNKRQFAKYDRDPNNLLALSRGMCDFYDGISLDVPIVNMLPGSVEETPSIGSRYKVEVFVKVLDANCICRVFYRLKDGSTKTDDPLVMKTFVHVEDPETFCFCMKWKHDYNEELWESFYDMTPAVD